MTVKEIEKNNQLIAAFMVEKNTNDYHRTWDSLMRVVEKIEEDEYTDVQILQHGTIILDTAGGVEIVNNCANISFTNKIEHTYDAVIEYLTKTIEDWLIADVVDKIKKDIKDGYTTAIYELLKFIPQENLLGFLPEI